MFHFSISSLLFRTFFIFALAACNKGNQQADSDNPGNGDAGTETDTGTRGDADTQTGADTDGDAGSDAGSDAGGALASGFAFHVVDVGSGLGIFLEGPGFTLVYDAGSDDDSATGDGNRFVAYLRAVRPDLRRIDHVILSHAHHDHVSLLPDVLARYEIGQVWDSGAKSDLCAYEAFLVAVQERAETYHSAVNDPGTHEIALPQPCTNFPSQATPSLTYASPLALDHGTRIATGMSVDLGSQASMKFLYVNADSGIDPNRNSLVIRIDIGGKRLLLMGDATAQTGDEDRVPSDPPGAGSVEARLLDQPDALAADVLVVGYHGWRYASSDALLSEVRPAISIIAGYPVFAPPDDVVIEALSQLGQVFRTDEADTACGTAGAKIGTANDHKPGGCSNVKVTIDETSQLIARYTANGH